MSVSGGPGGVNPSTSTKGLVVATDALGIYEAGTQYQVSIDDVADNPVALKMLFNDLNQSKRELAATKQGSIPPGVSIALAAVNALGVVLVGFGGAYVSMNPQPAGAGWIMGIGAALTLISTVTPVALAWARSRSQSDATTTSGIAASSVGNWGGATAYRQFSLARQRMATLLDESQKRPDK